MYARDRNATKRASGNERVRELADLVALGKIWVEVVLAIKFRVIGKFSPECKTHPKYMLYRFPIDDGERTRMRQAYWADIHIRTLLVGVVLRVTKHLCLCTQFGMNLQTYSRNIKGHIEKFCACPPLRGAPPAGGEQTATSAPHAP